MKFPKLPHFLLSRPKYGYFWHGIAIFFRRNFWSVAKFYFWQNWILEDPQNFFEVNISIALDSEPRQVNFSRLASTTNVSFNIYNNQKTNEMMRNLQFQRCKEMRGFRKRDFLSLRKVWLEAFWLLCKKHARFCHKTVERTWDLGEL